MSVIGPPMGTDPFATEIKPSVLWYWIGGGLILAGVIGGIVWGVIGFGRTMEKIEDFQRIDVPGTSEVFIDDPGGYTIFHEYEGAATSSWRPTPDIAITDPSGSPVPVLIYGPESSMTYDYGHEGLAVYTFDAPTVGTYSLEVIGEYRPGEQMAIGRSFTGTLVGAVLGAFLIGATGLILGLIILIVTAVKRGSAKRKASAAAWAAQSPAGGYGFPPPPAQYPPPPAQYPPPPRQYPPPPGQYPPPPGQYPPPPAQLGTWPSAAEAPTQAPAPDPDPPSADDTATPDSAAPSDWIPPIP